MELVCNNLLNCRSRWKYLAVSCWLYDVLSSCEDSLCFQSWSTTALLTAHRLLGSCGGSQIPARIWSNDFKFILIKIIVELQAEPHTHRNLWIAFLMVKMASSIVHGCIRMTQYYVTILWAQVLSSPRSHVFY